jgi:hypothetical protein
MTGSVRHTWAVSADGPRSRQYPVVASLSGRQLAVVGWFSRMQAPIGRHNQVDQSSRQAKGDKREKEQNKKSEKTSAQSGKNEIDHGIFPFLWR